MNGWTRAAWEASSGTPQSRPWYIVPAESLGAELHSGIAPSA